MNKAMRQSGPFVGWTLAWLAAASLGLVVLAGRTGAAPADEAGAAWKTLENEILPVYKERSTSEQRREFNSRAQKVRGIMSGAIPYAGNEAALEEFFLKYLFPSWTLTDEDHLGALAKDRDRFLTDLGRTAGPLHDKLIDLAFTKMQQIAQDQELHPGVRYNAVLLLGALNAREASRTPPANPEPLPKALPELEKLFGSADDSDAVRVAALLGIVRHLEWDDFRVSTTKLAADRKGAVVQQLIDLAKLSEPPAGRSLEGHTWMRRRALDGLFYVSLAGPSPEIAEVIEKLVADDKEPIALRCAAADIMGRLAYKTPAVPATEINGKQLGLLALAACHSELTRLENHEKLASLRTKLPSQFGGPMAMNPGMVGGMTGMPPGGMQAAPVGGAPQMDTSMMQGMMNKGKKSKAKSKAKGNPLDMLAGDPSGAPGAGAPKQPDNTNYRMEYVRRRMRAWLYAVQVGLGDARANPFNTVKREGSGSKVTFVATYTRGVAAYTQTDEQKTQIEEIIARVQDLVTIVETPDMTYETFAEELGAKMKELEQITGPLRVEAEAPKDAPAAAGPGRAAAIPDGPPEAPAAKVIPGVKAPAATPPAESVPAAAPPPAAKTPEAPPAAAAPPATK